MPITAIDEQVQDVPPLSDNVIGFVDTLDEVQQITKALTRTGIAVDRIHTFSGADGAEIYHEMMQGYSWGEESEETMRVGEKELASGHVVLMVETAERNEAIQIANLAQSLGGHGFRHFGHLTDERLTI